MRKFTRDYSKTQQNYYFIHMTKYKMKGRNCLQYFGGKARIASDIAKIINKYKKEEQVFLSPFVGGGWVEQYIEGKKIL